ncbi:hypothetical protein ACOT81_21665 [Streptomyces sp. WI04-05B]|uniref:hypothetical protein n=1 Tax=Streptomyces TaxID=1883 RepID=UPI0029A201C8|nr:MULTISPECIES: hypothetical protein [unclassified Streptomyces]MDX2544227.1 hypothetical protein [Streptomyces sp. WI04-05B]MDX2584643.1 hypothetical protein [Streptomyces sp. WI04-05A]MDX3749462.1 hypothetical protein [Streptomyces sp. AK08-02]
MYLVPRLLERVRTLVLGPPAFSSPTPDADRDDGSGVIVHDPSPEMWGAILVHARRRRAQRQGLVPTRAWFVELGAALPVRAYAFPPNGQARALTLSAQEVR